nr:NlpC/P60 family protein [Tessaracoccus coleopterorum]
MHTDSVSLAAQLLTSSDAGNFLSGLGVLQVEVDRSNAGIQQLQVDQARLTALEEDVAVTQGQLETDAAAKVALASDYDALESEAQAVYDRLSEQERQRLAAIEAERIRAAEAEQAAAEAASRTQAAGSIASPAPQASSDKESASEPAPSTGGSDRAQRVVDAALSKVGSRYVWGTSGENTFDCSGLTSWAYRQVGINITRSSRGQYSSVGTKVSKSQLRPATSCSTTAPSATWASTSATARSSTRPTRAPVSA